MAEQQITILGKYKVEVESPLQTKYTIDERSLKTLLKLVEDVHEILWKAGMVDVAKQLRLRASDLIVDKKLVWNAVED